MGEMIIDLISFREIITENGIKSLSRNQEIMHDDEHINMFNRREYNISTAAEARKSLQKSNGDKSIIRIYLKIVCTHLKIWNSNSTWNRHIIAPNKPECNEWSVE